MRRNSARGGGGGIYTGGGGVREGVCPRTPAQHRSTTGVLVGRSRSHLAHTGNAIASG